ncbi:MAG: aspartate kinase [Bacteroidia bacterium]|nr:aspartate kinase [Bacteroidia bacterium]
MKIFKFGGASVKDAESVRNLASIVKSFPDDLVIVVSAMGKTTNALESLTKNYFNGNAEGITQNISALKQYHFTIIEKLFGDLSNAISHEITSDFKSLEKRLRHSPSLDYDFEYDQIVSFGELLSTKITSAYLNYEGINNKWMDIRRGLRTDAIWREGNIDWALSSGLIQSQFNFAENRIYLTQGFIGATVTDQTTTLGREGSDYTAAIIANILNAESVTIWKDVPGIMNADPNKFETTQKLDMLSYREAVEMTYYGAKVIHPKTMKPLVEKNIPLYVRSFIKPAEQGSVICSIDHVMNYVPVIITKEDQVLITISPIDFSFMAEESISDIYKLFAQYRMKVNLVQQSAMNFSVAIDQPERGFDKLITDLKKRFVVLYNEGLELLTIRYYNEDVIQKMTQDRTVFVAQKTRTNARLLMK